MGYIGVSQILLVNKENYLHNWSTNKKKKIGEAVTIMIATATHFTLTH